MTSLVAVSGRRVALVSALLALACQQDGDAVFNNANLSEPSGGSSGSPGGSASSGGSGVAAGSSTAGSSSEAGEAGSEGGSDGGSSGSSKAGSGGRGEEGGSSGNSANAGMAGHAGTRPDPTPEPVTVLITEFEDAHVASCDPYKNHGNAATILVDADMDYGCAYQGLLRPLLDQIPDGALVSEATLSLYCSNYGSPVEASYVDQPWEESAVTWNERPSVGLSIGKLVCEEVGAVTLELTDAVQTWLGGESPYGVYLHGEEDGVDFASSEADSEQHRPQLSVTYVLPIK